MSEPSPSLRLGIEPSPAGHQPYVPDHVILPEFTWSAVLAGVVLGIIFGASSLYLVLKVGMTVSASIPVAVLSITLFRVFFRIFGVRRASILENNIVQTTGSAGESVAFGVGVTMPAVMLLGFEMEIARVMVVSVLGGLLGILMMIPLRRAFIVKQHDTLKYPEGTACADVLIIGETGGATAKTVFGWHCVCLPVLMLGLRLWKDTISHQIGSEPRPPKQTQLAGRGLYHRNADFLHHVAGGVLAWLVLCPAIMYFGEALSAPLAPATMLIRHMDADQLRKFYVLYIGAGAVAAGGIISLCRALPLIVASIGAGLRDMCGSSPLPLGEGQGVRADDCPDAGPHPNPLPKGEGTRQTSCRATSQQVLRTTDLSCGSYCSARWLWCWRSGRLLELIPKPAAAGRGRRCSIG